MGKIIVLDELTACQIAAGEVVERPASVVKEMVENAIDAGADKITVEIKNGGIKYIGIDDNGSGFAPDDAVIAFDKHATSKIRNSEDLFHVGTLGFRGEALASIAAVSEVELRTKEKGGQIGVYVKFAGGELAASGECGCKEGSSFVVRNLFYNTPARYKFLKKDATEAGYVVDTLQKLALSHPDVSFRLISDGKNLLFTPGNGDLMSCIHSIFGKQISSFVRPVEYTANGLSVKGFAGVREASYGNRGRQFFFVNGRFIKNKTITTAVDEAYKTVTMKGKFPFVILDLSVNPSLVDVNVHPTKIEVRFSDENAIFRAVFHALRNALFGEDETVSGAADEPVHEVQKENPARASFPEQSGTFKRSMTGETASAYVSLFETAERLSESARSFAEKTKEKNIFAAEESAVEERSAETPAAADAVAPNAEVPLKEVPVPPVNTALPERSAMQEPPVNEIKATGEIYGDNDVYLNSTVVGQLFDTYILLQYKNELVLLDQHAAHERLMYEKIKQSLETETAESQLLLAPLQVRLSPAEFAAFRENSLFFERAGFEIEDFGNNTVMVRSVPMILAGSDITEFIISGIGLVTTGKEKVSLFSDRAVYTMACKAAIKANRKLREEEIDALLKYLAAVKNPGTCPHGRPITIKYTKYEIERKFHRC